MNESPEIERENDSSGTPLNISNKLKFKASKVTRC